MAGDSSPELRLEPKTKGENNAAHEKLAADAGLRALPKPSLTLSSSELLVSDAKAGLSVSAKQGIANFVGTATAGIAGTMAWSVADKAVGNTRYGLGLKLASALIAGGAARFGGKGTTELALLDGKDRTTGLSDLAWGGVDALSAIGAVKAEEAFSSAWKTSLGRASGAHLSQELLEEQGKKILEGNLGQRIYHNTLRGIVGGGTGAMLWSTPHELSTNFNKLDTLAGWEDTGKGIAASTLFGGAFGGVLMGGGTAIYNSRELAGMTKAAVLGKQGRYSLDVYHFNDGHSSVLGDRSTLGQLAGKAEELQGQSQKAGTSSLTLDLGDMHSGNAAAVVSNTGKLEQQVIQEHMQVTASVPGNHVADTGLYNGPKDVAQWMKNMTELDGNLKSSAGREVPGVAANVQSLLDPKFISADGVYKPYRIFLDPKTGDKVGLVGLVTEQLQTATPKLLDSDLAVAAAKYGNMSFKELSETAATDPASKELAARLAANAGFSKALTQSPEAKISALVEDVVQKQYLKGLTPEQAENWRGWFALAGEHPTDKLENLAARLPENKTVADMAALYPHKRISDLYQVMVSDPKKALEDSVKALNAEGVNKVVVLSHLGKSYDLHLAAEGPRVAAIFGGHSHDLEPVPLFARNQATGQDVLVTQAGHSYGWLGEGNLVFNNDGSINRYLSAGKMHVIDENVRPMKSAQDAVLNYMQATPHGQLLLKQVGERQPLQVGTEIPLDDIRGQKGRQTPLANLLVNAFKEGGDKTLPELNAARAQSGLPVLGDSVDAVLIQSGGIRAGLPAGPVDELTLQTMFMNRPALVEMSGAEIEKTLSYGVHDFPKATQAQGLMDKAKDFFSAFGREESPLAHYDASGRNIIAGGLRFNVDRSLPTYGRAVNVEIFDKSAGKYLPIDPAKRYTVMTVSHLVGRMGNTPLIPASQLRSMSLSELGPEYWVLGRRMELPEVTQIMKPTELPASNSRDFLLDYLKSNSVDGKFALPPALLESPMKDISPGAWVPPLRPSLTAAAATAAVAVENEKKKLERVCVEANTLSVCGTGGSSTAE